MRPRQPPAPRVEPDEPTEFTRQHDMATNYGGPREFARRTRGSWSEAGTAEVIEPDPTGSAAP